MSLNFGKTTELLYYHKYVWTFKMENRSVYVLIILFFKLEYNCFTVLHQFLCCSALVAVWMDLEFVIESAVSQKEKNKYHIFACICGIQKNATDEPISKAGLKTQRADMWAQ